jgi:hypothetical protein
MRTLASLGLALLLSTTALAGPVTIETDAGPLYAIDEGTGDRGVVLVHADGRSRAGWQEFGEALVDAGFRVVALDLRGHGQTGGALSEDAYPTLDADVNAAVVHLRSSGTSRVSVVGDELGGVLAFRQAAADEGIEMVVMLTPRLSLKGLKVTTALSGFGDTPLLMVAGSKDTSGVRAGGALAGKITGATLEVVDDGTSGLQLFQQSAKLESRIVSWLDSFGQPQAASGPRTDALRTSGADDIETTGKRLGED